MTKKELKVISDNAKELLKELKDQVDKENRDVITLWENYSGENVVPVFVYCLSKHRDDPLVKSMLDIGGLEYPQKLLELVPLSDSYTLFEDFLAMYNPEMRKDLGVWETPQPIVDAITRFTNQILVDIFDQPEGLSGENIKVLDFACGTGNFLKGIYNFLPEDKPIHTKNHMGIELNPMSHQISKIELSNTLKGQPLPNLVLGNTLTEEIRDLVDEFFPNPKKQEG